MTEFQYHNEIDSNERYFSEKLNEETERVQEYVNNAYEHLEKACALYLKSDAMGITISYTEFKKYLIQKIEEVL